MVYFDSNGNLIEGEENNLFDEAITEFARSKDLLNFKMPPIDDETLKKAKTVILVPEH